MQIFHPVYDLSYPNYLNLALNTLKFKRIALKRFKELPLTPNNPEDHKRIHIYEFTLGNTIYMLGGRHIPDTLRPQQKILTLI